MSATFLIIPLVVIVGFFLVVLILSVLVLRMVKGGGGAQGKEQEIEETRMIQDVYHGLQKMEQRVEALETILLDTERKDKDV